MYPQGRCVYVPTRDPTSRADFEQVDELWTPVTTTNKYLQIKMDVILVSCKTIEPCSELFHVPTG